MRSMIRWLYACELCLSIASTANAQLARGDSTNAVALVSSRIHDFQSAINGHPYRLWVVLPTNYDSRLSSKYPVLYLLDGGITLAPAVSVYRVANRTTDSLIMVGVGFSDGQGPKYRAIDYSLPLSAVPDTSMARAARAGTCCQAAKTVRVFRDEIIPLIERLYRTTPDRGILGISWSAIFAAYVLVNDPELFGRYAITSPSPWSDNDALFEREAKYAESHGALNKHVFISVGADEGVFNRYSAARLAATLRARNYQGLDLTSVILPDAYHNSVQQYAPALRALYPPKQYVEFARDSALRLSAANFVKSFLAAYARTDAEAIRRTLVRGIGFQAIVDGKVVIGPEAYLRAIAPVMRREKGFRLDTLHVGVDAPYQASDAPHIAVFIAAYTVHVMRRPRETHRTLAIQLQQVANGWKIAYVLHSPSDTARRVTAVRVESGGAPVANAEVVAEWTAGPFASARTNSAGVALLPFDWHFDWLRTGRLLVRAAGFQPALIPAPTRDSIIVQLSKMANTR